MGYRKFSAVLSAAALFSGFAGMSAAQTSQGQTPPSEAPAPATPAVVAISEQEARDAAVVQAAATAYGRDRPAAIREYLPQLRRVMANAPESYPRTRLFQDEGVWLIRQPYVGQNGSIESALFAALAAGTQAAGQDDDPSTVQMIGQYNTYGMAALLLGVFSVEARQPEAAIQFLDAGLKLQPDNAQLYHEKGQALALMRRWQDMFEVYDTAIKGKFAFTDRSVTAGLLRGEGFALIELQRLDEAEAAFKESLTLAPNHAGALNELAYIAQLRAGGPRAPVVQVPRSGAPAAPPAPAAPSLPRS